MDARTGRRLGAWHLSPNMFALAKVETTDPAIEYRIADLKTGNWPRGPYLQCPDVPLGRNFLRLTRMICKCKGRAVLRALAEPKGARELWQG